MVPFLSLIVALAAALPLAFIPAQSGSSAIVNGVLFALIAGAAVFAVCRSSRRN